MFHWCVCCLGVLGGISEGGARKAQHNQNAPPHTKKQKNTTIPSHNLIHEDGDMMRAFQIKSHPGMTNPRSVNDLKVSEVAGALLFFCLWCAVLCAVRQQC